MEDEATAATTTDAGASRRPFTATVAATFASALASTKGVVSSTLAPARPQNTSDDVAPAVDDGFVTEDSDTRDALVDTENDAPAPAEAESFDSEAVEAEPEPEPEPEASADTAPDPDTPGAPESLDDADRVVAPDDEVTPESDATPASVKTARKRRPVRTTAASAPAAPPASVDIALAVDGLTKRFGGSAAVDGIDLQVQPGSFFGIVGPNGAGKTTTLSMITGLLRPDDGVVRVFGLDVWANAHLAKKQIGVLPDRLRLFDRLTGAEFLHHAGALRGLDRATIAQRSADLAAAFGLEHSLHRLVSDYSAGMTKKIAIAAAMIHAPRLLVLDEPFESVDPVSTSVVLDVLRRFTAAGGTVVLSSHSMELTERVCDAIAVIAEGVVLAAGPLEEVLDGRSLEERFVELAGGEAAVEGMEWLQNFSD